MEPLAKKLGLELVPHSQPLTAETLRGVGLVQLQTPVKRIEPAEQQVLIDFVKRGGALLVVSDEELRIPLPASDVNSLLQAFGLKFTGDVAYLHNCGALAIKGPINAAERQLPFSGGRAVEGGTPFSRMIGEDGKPSEHVHGAFVEQPNGGRVVALSEAMASLLMGTVEGVRRTGEPRDPAKTTYWGKDSTVFMEEVVTWLTRG